MPASIVMGSKLVPSGVEGAAFPGFPGAAGVNAMAHYRRLGECDPPRQGIGAVLRGAGTGGKLLMRLEGRMGLSAAVEAAVPEAASMVREMVVRLQQTATSKYGAS